MNTEGTLSPSERLELPSDPDLEFYVAHELHCVGSHIATYYNIMSGPDAEAYFDDHEDDTSMIYAPTKEKLFSRIQQTHPLRSLDLANVSSSSNWWRPASPDDVSRGHCRLSVWDKPVLVSADVTPERLHAYIDQYTHVRVANSHFIPDGFETDEYFVHKQQRKDLYVLGKKKGWKKRRSAPSRRRLAECRDYARRLPDSTIDLANQLITLIPDGKPLQQLELPDTLTREHEASYWKSRCTDLHRHISDLWHRVLKLETVPDPSRIRAILKHTNYLSLVRQMYADAPNLDLLLPYVYEPYSYSYSLTAEDYSNYVLTRVWSRRILKTLGFEIPKSLQPSRICKSPHHSGFFRPGTPLLGKA